MNQLKKEHSLRVLSERILQLNKVHLIGYRQVFPCLPLNEFMESKIK